LAYSVNNLRENLPNPFKPQSISKLLPFILIYTIPFIINWLLSDQLNPFSLSGPDFLVFFLLFSVATIINLIILGTETQKLLPTYLTDYLPDDINIFQAIYFLYGRTQGYANGHLGFAEQGLAGPSIQKLF
jgi:hypothetical protein